MGSACTMNTLPKSYSVSTKVTVPQPSSVMVSAISCVKSVYLWNALFEESVTVTEVFSLIVAVNVCSPSGTNVPSFEMVIKGVPPEKSTIGVPNEKCVGTPLNSVEYSCEDIERDEQLAVPSLYWIKSISYFVPVPEACRDDTLRGEPLKRVGNGIGDEGTTEVVDTAHGSLIVRAIVYVDTNVFVKAAWSLERIVMVF